MVQKGLEIGESYKIVVLGSLLAFCLLITYYFHFIVLDADLNITWANEIAVKEYGAVIGRKCYEAYK
jgi:hypothetical protein